MARIRSAGIAANLAAVAAIIAAISAASAAEIRVLGSVAVKVILNDELIPEFERLTGNKVAADFSSASALKQRIDAGETFDLAILTPVGMVDDLIKSGTIASDAHGMVGRAGLGVVIRAGAPKPDISTVDAFKRALISTKSIAITDPAAGGVGAVYFMGLMQSSGIADEIKAKLKPTRPGDAALAVSAGEAELGIAGISEIISVRGVELLGPFPEQVQFYVGYAAGVSAKAKEPVAARALLNFITSPAAASAIKARGMEPG
jgi:molybdate transport system substrate-binding protein